jgi:hypothetical protein
VSLRRVGQCRGLKLHRTADYRSTCAARRPGVDESVISTRIRNHPGRGRHLTALVLPRAEPSGSVGFHGGSGVIAERNRPAERCVHERLVEHLIRGRNSSRWAMTRHWRRRIPTNSTESSARRTPAIPAR